jgi:sigma-B regulation protein RsbU (phosphoserine phosphatase)
VVDVATNAFYAALGEDDPEDLYDNAPCGYLSCRLDGTILKVNQTFLTWTGHTREALVGERRFQELLSVGGQIYYETHYGPMLQMQGEAREIAVDIVRADGSRLPALINSVVARGDNGSPTYVRTAVFDATDRRAYERELLAARRQAEESEARARVLAQTLQQSLLPPATPQIPGLDVAAVYRPAGQGGEVGGDFYDVFESREGDWIVSIGDVRGKGAGRR